MDVWISGIIQALIAMTLAAILNSTMKIRERIIALETLLVGVKETTTRHSDAIKGIDESHGNAIRALERDAVVFNAFMKRIDRQEA